jgi:hypothetical protein
MNYFLDLFSPETHAAFSASDRLLSGFSTSAAQSTASNQG